MFMLAMKIVGLIDLRGKGLDRFREVEVLKHSSFLTFPALAY
jgi:hypothetical protein